MGNKDLTFITKDGKFNYRVAAIIIKDNKVLMISHNGVPYYYSIGGRVKFNETSEEAVIREAFEETGVKFKIDRLGFLHENFFEEEGTKEFYHEIDFFYYLKSDEEFEVVCDSVNEYGNKEYFEWLPIDKLNEYKIYPEFFKERLIKDSNIVEHLITRNNETVLK